MFFFASSLAPFPSTSHVPATIYNSSQLISPYAFGSNYNNSNNNNNILDAQSFYTSVPLNHFSTILTATKPIGNVCHTPSSTSSLSSFDEPPPVKPRLSLRPQLPPPPPPPFVPTFSSSIPQFRGPTRPAPKPPVQQQVKECHYHRMSNSTSISFFFLLAYFSNQSQSIREKFMSR